MTRCDALRPWAWGAGVIGRALAQGLHMAPRPRQRASRTGPPPSGAMPRWRALGVSVPS